MPDTVNLGGYTITFLGTESIEDMETWSYSVTKEGNPDPEIKSWTLELCFKPLHNVISSSGSGVVVIGQGKPCIPMAGRTIKWEQLNNDNVEGIYTFTLEGSYQKAERQIAVYAGPFCHRALITGPSCVENPREEYPEEELYLAERSGEANVNNLQPNVQFEEDSENQKLINPPIEDAEDEKEFQDIPPQLLTRGVRIF